MIAESVLGSIRESLTVVEHTRQVFVISVCFLHKEVVITAYFDNVNASDAFALTYS